jgi:La domain
MQFWMPSPDDVNEQESVSHEIATVSLDEVEVDPGQGVGETDKAAKVCRQIEHYFSDANLPTDEYLLTRIRRNKQGWGEPWPTCLPGQQKSSDSLAWSGSQFLSPASSSSTR